MKRFQNIFLYLAAAGMLATASSCSDDFQSPDVNREGVTGITLMIPNTEGATQFAKTRSADAETRGATRAGKEGAIIDGDLWLFAYANNPANNYIEKLNVGDAPLEQNAYKKVTVTLAPDTYQMYVVANLSNYLSNITLSKDLSRTDLENAILNFSSDKPLSLENGLPMACKNTEIKLTEGGTAVENGKVEIEAGTNKTIFADLTFLCSKVRYTLLFDRADFSSAFGTSSFDLTGTAISNVANVTKWYSPADADYTSPFSLSGSPEAKQYPANVSTLEQDGETLGKLEGDANADKMAWQEVLYLPENLSTEDSKKTTLTLNTSVAGQASSYEIILNNNSKKEDKDLKRGRFYDIIAKAKTNDIYEISLNVKDWDPEEILMDFTHTYLTLSQTSDIKVGSLTPVEINYDTDGVGELGFECKTEINSLPVIKRGDVKEHDGKKVIEFEINPSIDVSKVDKNDRKGTAEVWITAGNIKKKVEVEYDITPFFVITPTERTIAFVKGADNQTEFQYVTNLGGLRIRKYGEAAEANHSSSFDSDNGATEADYKSKLNIRVAGDNFDAAEDYLIMKETTENGPKTSAVQMFVVEPVNFPEDEPKENYQKVLTVTVQPKMDDYRIYFRAINDYFSTKGDAAGHTEDYLKIFNYSFPDGDSWLDGWNGNNNFASNDQHHIYVYNQSGNNSTFTSLSKDVNNLVKWGENDKMTGDNNNTGWYYFDLKNQQYMYLKHI
ncbi:MAG: hypothetical protein K2J48_09925 [Muribaculaceae bacterium]|nr:hypothetical protein [Muribaculaceae bacterium]